MKLKSTRRCPDGEVYHFINGIAIIPGVWDKKGNPQTVSLKEFNETIKELKEKGLC